jgi:hypothetical protein
MPYLSLSLCRYQRASLLFLHRFAIKYRYFILSIVCLATITAANGANDLPPPEQAGFEHVVVVMMENRSFDHFFGWLPGANGQQAGVSYKDSAGVSHPTHALAPDYQGCGFSDPGHSYANGRVQYNNGGADGWLLDGSGNDIYAVGYYVQSDLPFLSPAATTLPSATIISLASFQRHIPIVFISTLDKPIGYPTPVPPRPFRQSGTGWQRKDFRVATILTICLSWHCGAPVMSI